MSQTIHVVGAGISGLSLAYELAKAGFSVHIYEKNNRIGGLIDTLRTPHGLVETAANSILVSPTTLTLLQEVEAPIVFPQNFAKKRYLFNGKPTRWPLSPLDTITLIGRVFFHLLTKKKHLQPRPFESLQQWGYRNLGKSTTDLVISPAMQGIYASPAEDLSATLLLSGLFKKNRERSLGIISGAHGMKDIMGAFQRACEKKGVRFHFSKAIRLQDLQGPVVIATAAPDAQQLLKEFSPASSEQLAQIPLNNVTSATVFFEKESSSASLTGFGCLIPNIFGLKTLGVLFNPSIFPNRDQSPNETYILGGSEHADVVHLSDEKIRELIEKESAKIFGRARKIVDISVHKWEQVLPHYSVELEKILPELKMPNNIFLHGNYLGGIGMSKIIERSIELAQVLKRKSNEGSL